MEATRTSRRDHVPERTCVGCRARRPTEGLQRWVLTADGHALASRTAAGRGAWVCAGQPDCLDRAVRRHGFERAWRRPVPDVAMDELKRAAERALVGRLDDEKG